ncbi:alpha/beta fold hydrolase [Azohydromonas caseinilytica]|uniref:Alpha/beta hydrolase n=1 Tax=Azohydromonas caseinilytica TaxID=2728836 RepID=A0A848FHI1_9BURK|nr:alpha/beta hydrolase [Azohydromonas caseinilytica]NML18305.1 alpha/beta hydrolase [Azohydromonas caseinilytica]
MTGRPGPGLADAGCGRTWVLLRGLTREAGHWGGFPQALARHLPGRVLTPDLPGNGLLHRQASPLRVADMVASCREQLRAQGARPPFHVLALSLGSMVALDWARAHGDEIAAGVLINTSLRGVSPWTQRLRPAGLARLPALLLGRDDAAREAAILRLTSRRLTAPPPHWLALRRARPVSRLNALRQLVAAARFHPPPAAPAVPLLLLAARGDALVDARCSQALAARWGLPLALHPEAGHDLPLDDEAWVVERIEAWLQGQDEHTLPGVPHAALARMSAAD